MDPERLEECYRLLEVPPDASREVIRKAYLLLVNVWHPDRFQSSPDLEARAHAKLQTLNRAYEAIQGAPLAPNEAARAERLEAMIEEDRPVEAGNGKRSAREWLEQGQRLTTSTGRMSSDGDGLGWSGIPDFNRYVEGLRAFGEAVRLDPKCVPGWFGLGQAHLVLGEFEPAIRALTETVTLAPSHAAAWVSLGTAYAGRDRQAEAADAFRHAVIAQPNDTAAWYALGIACTKLKRDDDAIAAYREVVRLNPDLAEAWCALGVALAFPRTDRPVEPEEALAAFREALSLRPELAEAWFRLGATLSGLRRHEEALDALQQAVKLQPASADAWFSLGIAARYSSRQGASRMVREAYWRLKNLDAEMASRLRELLPYGMRLSLLAIRPPSRRELELG
jgi:cytochrome c-type biogenesis protein CcmH/NrfG